MQEAYLYEYALTLKFKQNDTLLQQIIKILNDNHFITKTIQQDKTIILLIGLDDYSKFYQEALKIGVFIRDEQQIYVENNEYQSKVETEKKKNLSQSLEQQMTDQLNQLNRNILLFEERQLFRQKHVDEILNIKQLDNSKQNILTVISLLIGSSERLRIIHSLISNLSISDEYIIDYLEKNNILEGFVPLHEDQKIKNLDQIRSYYGEEVGIYFQFYRYYQQYLIIPSMLGLFIKFIIYLFGFSESHFLHNIFSYSMIIWGNLFCIMCKRKIKELEIEWSSYEKFLKLSDKNKHYIADVRINLITGLPEQYYPKRKKYFKYFISVLETLPILFFSIFIKIIYLNLKQYTVPTDLWLHNDWISNLNKPGGILYDHFILRTLVDVLILLITIQLNNVNIVIAKSSSLKENHELNDQINDSIILKRFLFEIINRFSHILYLAFYRLDMQGTKTEIFYYYALNDFLCILYQNVIPLIKIKFKKQHQKEMKQKKFDQIESFDQTIIDQLELDEYQKFDDFIEIVIQFAYVTIFAGVLITSPFISLIFSCIQFYSDELRLKTKINKRPIPSKSFGMKNWLIIINVISIISIFSNCLFVSIFQNQYILSNQYHKNWDYVFLQGFIQEHIFIFLIFFLRRIIPKTPYWVKIFKERRQKAKPLKVKKLNNK